MTGPDVKEGMAPVNDTHLVTVVDDFHHDAEVLGGLKLRKCPASPRESFPLNAQWLLADEALAPWTSNGGQQGSCIRVISFY